jgi:hypothetical protein
MKMSIEERIKILEDKVLKLEGGNLIRDENPYKVETKEEAFVRV